MNRRTTFRTRLAPALAMLAGAALATTSVLPTAPAGAAVGPTAGPAAKAAKPARSDIGLLARSVGTRITGGDIPASSGRTAFTFLGCSPRGGISRENHVATADVPGLGTISGVSTRVWTRQGKKSVHSFSRSSTALVKIVDSALGSLSLKGVTSRTHTWYDGSKFHADTTTSVGSIVFTPAVGSPQTLDIPSPGQAITVPGLATIRFGGTHKAVGQHRAKAIAMALRIDLDASNSTLWVSRSSSQAFDGIRNGRFGGYSAGTEVEVAGGVLSSGRNPLTHMPCQGTKGEVQGNDDADINVGGGLHVEGVSSKQSAYHGKRKSRAWERGSVAGVNLGGGALVIDAVVGRATVVRTAHGLKRSAAGTRIGSITASGEQQSLPLDQTLEIPGVAKLEPKVVTKVHGGLKVVALRITLLDGTGAVIDLGVARVSIQK